MRDPNRIQKFCDELAALWRIVPDWRFGQLLSNVLGDWQGKTHQDIFFPEDDEMIQVFRDYFAQEGVSPWQQSSLPTSE